MSLTFQCGECGRQYTVPDQMAGKWVKCKHCESTLEVPGPPPPNPAEPPAKSVAKTPAPKRPTPQQPLRKARPISTPQTPSPPIPEAVLLPDPEPEPRPLPQQATRPLPQQTSRPAPAQPTRPVPQSVPQPLRPAPIRPSSRPRISGADEGAIDKKVIILAAGAVGVVLAVVILMMVVVFGSDPGGDRETASGSSQSGGTQAGADEPGVVDFAREPAVEFGPARTMSSAVPGVAWKEVQLRGNSDNPGPRGKLWVYLPSGSHEPGSLGCVLIGPAGSRMVHGMALADGDRAEHFPYAEQGFAVVAFEIDGPLPDDDPPDDRFREAYLKFTDAAAGVVNARIALQYATTEIPEVDRDRIFVAGHSSAGTVALLAAAHVDGLAGCVAYAPCSDLEGFLAGFVGDIDGVLPNVRQYMKDGSPNNHVEQLDCPVMIFHAIDDRVVRLSESNTFVGRAKAAGHDVTLRTGVHGGHYDAMIDEGIDEAINWMNRTKPATSTLASDSASPSPSASGRPRPTPGFRPPTMPTPPAMPPGGAIRAHIHLDIKSYPRLGNPETIAREALRSVIWVEPNAIRIDRSTNELIIGVRIMMINTNTAKLHLERAGFVIGGASLKPVPN